MDIGYLLTMQFLKSATTWNIVTCVDMIKETFPDVLIVETESHDGGIIDEATMNRTQDLSIPKIYQYKFPF